MDPVATNDETLSAYKEDVMTLISYYDDVITIHDFRMVPGTTHTNLIFDAVVPANYKKTNDVVKEELTELVQREIEGCYAVITVEQSYV